MKSFKNKRICVLGIGISGKATLAYLLEQGAFVTVVDRHLPARLEGLPAHACMTCGDETDPATLAKIDLLIPSPGVAPSHPLLIEAKKRGIPILGEMEIAAQTIPHPCVGITGTNGKTTVTALVDHNLRCAGFSSSAFGNIGRPLVEALNLPAVYCAVELSSFQLDLLKTPFLDAAVLLNITPDHHERYPNQEDYVRSKWHIFDCVKAGGRKFLSEQVLPVIARESVEVFGFHPSHAFFTDGLNLFEYGAKAGELPPLLQGKRDFRVRNFLGAYALSRAMGAAPEMIVKAFSTFSTPPHRLQFLGRYRGVSFFNDSKATNVASVLTALEATEAPIILLAGGRAKGEPFAPWKELLQKKAKALVAFGEAAPKIADDLSFFSPRYTAPGLASAFSQALHLAKEGDSVLLSPGCASYDEFDNYMRRGELFNTLVLQALREGESR